MTIDPLPARMAIIVAERDLATDTMIIVARRFHSACHVSPAIEQCGAEICKIVVAALKAIKGDINADT